MALYAAKAQELGRIAVFQPAMRAAMQKRTSELSLARRALREDLILPVYQPKVELGSGKLVGFEALLRWKYPGRGLQVPETIAAAFEDYELARELTDRILAGVLRDMRGWLDRGIQFGHVAVNAAAADFKQKDFAERLLERLDAAAVPHEKLQVEVTETVFLGRGAEHVERALKTLSASGIRIALDDFGTGYASLSHLKQFPVDVVKIDRSFLRDVREDAHNAAIIKTVVSLGRSLQLDVVAEGVETPQQEAFLVSQGCRLGQGFLYGKAAPAERLPDLIRSWPEKLRAAA
jgi:EAL domain-containing protein (putative c-di-GMP-specific phosphodiesterase class I)